MDHKTAQEQKQPVIFTGTSPEIAEQYKQHISSLQSTIDRYEKALREIQNPKYSRYDCYEIASNALKQQ